MVEADWEEQGYAVRFVPFDEWADVDTLLHRAAVSSGDFDYLLRPLCPDCGGDLRLDYEDVGGEGSSLAVLICETCHITWQVAPDEPDTPGS
jgi:hypothetical protein